MRAGAWSVFLFLPSAALLVWISACWAWCTLCFCYNTSWPVFVTKHLDLFLLWYILTCFCYDTSWPVFVTKHLDLFLLRNILTCFCYETSWPVFVTIHLDLFLLRYILTCTFKVVCVEGTIQIPSCLRNLPTATCLQGREGVVSSLCFSSYCWPANVLIVLSSLFKAHCSKLIG